MQPIPIIRNKEKMILFLVYANVMIPPFVKRTYHIYGITSPLLPEERGILKNESVTD
jgi:hypothetical protein